MDLWCTKVHAFVSALFERVQALVDTARAFFAVKVFGDGMSEGVVNQDRTVRVANADSG